jgi:hypothetical protein
VRINGGAKRCYLPSDVIEAHSNDRLEVVDVRTNVSGNKGIEVNLKGMSRGKPKDILGKHLTLDKSFLKGSVPGSKGYEYALVVNRGSLSLDKFKVLVASE